MLRIVMIGFAKLNHNSKLKEQTRFVFALFLLSAFWTYYQLAFL